MKYGGNGIQILKENEPGPERQRDEILKGGEATMIHWGDMWDFHTDLRNVQRLPPDRIYLREQIDLASAAKLGGIFSATGRMAGAPSEVQIEKLKEEVELIRSAEGLRLVLNSEDVEGGGRQVLHAEGVYFVKKSDDLSLIDWMWDVGFRSLAPLYNEDNALGGGSMGDATRGLTGLGRDFSLHAWGKGFLLDCAHANHRTKNDLIDLALVTGFPLHYSHGHLGDPVVTAFGERGLPREMAQRLLETGGLVGLSPHPGFLGKFGRHLEEIEFLAEIRPGSVVLGTDFAGTNTPGPQGNRLFDECMGVWGLPDFARTLAEIHGEDFARDYFGNTLKTFLEKSLPGS